MKYVNCKKELISSQNFCKVCGTKIYNNQNNYYYMVKNDEYKESSICLNILAMLLKYWS